MNINRIGRYNLFAPMSAIVDRDESGYVATTPDVPQVYGCGDTIHEAVSMLTDEILSLHQDLQRDDEYTPELLALRDFFQRIFTK